MGNAKTEVMDLLKTVEGHDAGDQAALALIIKLLDGAEIFLAPSPVSPAVNIDAGDENADWIKHAHCGNERAFATVGDLMSQFQSVDPALLVIMQRDPEGNEYSEFGGMFANSLWDDERGALGIAVLTDDLRRQGFAEGDLGEGKPCLVLYPNC